MALGASHYKKLGVAMGSDNSAMQLKALLDPADDVTAGTVTASKSMVVDSNKDIGTVRHFTISGNLVTGSTTITETELAYLDGITAGTGAASKALILDASGNGTLPGTLAVAGLADLNGNTLTTEAGAGITDGTGTIYKSSILKIGGIIHTQILIDLTGCSSATTDLDIIGTGASVAHLGRITAADNGTILSGRMTCLELPSSLTDIDFYSATESTGVFEALVTSLTQTALITKGGAWSAGDVNLFQTVAADQYLYLTNGAADTADVFTAGKFLIELQGYDA